jgi:hypothetical protein
MPAIVSVDDSALRQIARDLVSAVRAAIAQRWFPVSPGGESPASKSPAAQPRPLRILLIEEDRIDAAWITELIYEKRPGTEVVHSASLPQALFALAQLPIDAVFISVHPEGRTASTEDCRELVRRPKGRPVVAPVNGAEMNHAADVRATGVRFLYCKHPIMRTAHIRKLEARERWEAQIAEQKSRARSASATTASAQSRAGA